MCYLKINSRSLLQISVVHFKDGTSLGKDGEQSWRNMEFRMRTLCMCPITFNHIKNKPVWDGLSSLTWHVILLEEDGYTEKMTMVRKNKLALMDPKCAKNDPPHYYTTSSLRPFCLCHILSECCNRILDSFDRPTFL